MIIFIDLQRRGAIVASRSTASESGAFGSPGSSAPPRPGVSFVPSGGAFGRTDSEEAWARGTAHPEAMFSRNAFSQERERHQVFQWLPSHLIVSRGIRLRIRLRIALHSSSNCTAFGFGLHCIRLRIARRSSARAEPSGGPERVGRRDSDSRPAITMGRRAAPPGRRPVHGDAIGSGAIGARTVGVQAQSVQ